MELVLNINNKNVIVNVPTDEMLLTTLRNLGYYSVRCGCATTEITNQVFSDFIITSIRISTFQCDSAHHHTGSTETTLVSPFGSKTIC